MGGKYAPEKLGFPLSVFAGVEPAPDIREWEAISAWAERWVGKLGAETSHVSDPVDQRPPGTVPSRDRLLTGPPEGMRRGPLQYRLGKPNREKKGAIA